MKIKKLVISLAFTAVLTLSLSAVGECVEYPVVKGKTALLIVDAQGMVSESDSTLYTPGFQSTIVKIKSIAEEAAANNIPIFAIRYVYDEDGSNVDRLGDFGLDGFLKKAKYAELENGLRKFLKREKIHHKVIRKTGLSSFVNTRLEGYLKSQGIDTLIITGFVTQLCSGIATIHAHDKGYKVIFVQDANDGPSLPDVGFGAAPIEDIKRVIHTTLRIAIADVSTTATVLDKIRTAE